jgi:hypothetical protein
VVSGASTMLTSQLPIAAWHAEFGDPALADSILDRLVHNAHRLDSTASQCAKAKRQARGRRPAVKQVSTVPGCKEKWPHSRPVPSALPSPLSKMLID